MSDVLSVVRGPDIDDARPLSGGRISVSPAVCNRDASYYPLIKYLGRVYLFDKRMERSGRLHYRDITPDQSELDEIDSLDIFPGGRVPLREEKFRYFDSCAFNRTKS
jgi:hypothetical protein